MSSTPGIVKKILNAGNGSIPNYKDGTRVLFDYEVLYPLHDVNKEGFSADHSDFKTIDSTRLCWPDGYGKPLELVFGKKFQLPVFERCLMSMLVGEVSQFDIDASLMAPYPMVSKKLRDISRSTTDKKFEAKHQHHCAAMGPLKTDYEILDELLKNPRPLRVIFHLLSVEGPGEYQADNWQLNESEKSERAESLREEGNSLYREKRFSSAIEKYREALGLIDQLLIMEKPGDNEWTQIDQRNIPLFLNLSQCYLNESAFREAEQSASEVLKRSPDNEKALFRRAKARIGIWELDLAEEDLNTLARVSPNNAALITEQKQILQKKRSEKETDDRSVYKKMF